MTWLQSADQSTRTATRANTSIIGTVLVIALTVLLASAVGAAVLGAGSTAPTPDPAPAAVIDLSVEGETLRFTHRSGATLDLREVSVRISVDGEPLADQPPVPFFSAAGFEPGPTGPFNTATDPQWEVGETATLTVAGTNSPQIEPGSTVSVRIHTDRTAVIRTETTA